MQDLWCVVMNRVDINSSEYQVCVFETSNLAWRPYHTRRDTCWKFVANTLWQVQRSAHCTWMRGLEYCRYSTLRAQTLILIMFSLKETKSENNHVMKLPRVVYMGTFGQTIPSQITTLNLSLTIKFVFLRCCFPNRWVCI